MEAFIDSHTAGDDLLTSNLKAARSLSFAQAINKEPSSAATAGMLAYINEAITQKDRVFDPVCGAATLAYWENFIEKKDESAASEAAAIAYLNAREANPDFDENGPCGKAAK